MDVFEVFATNTKKEEEGVEVKIGPDSYITVARNNNRHYVKLLSTMFEENRQLLESGTEEGDKANQALMAEVIAKTILLGWRGLEYQGQPIEYSLENAKMLLQHHEFLELVMKHARRAELFRATIEDSALKN